MRDGRCLLVLLIGFCAVLPGGSHAAGNPALDTLAQGTVVQFTGKEALSEPFMFELTVAAPDKALNFSLVVGQPLTIAVLPGRTVNGMIERIEQLEAPGVQGLYRVRLVPSLNRLKYRSTSRTFYGMMATDIVKTLLTEAGVTNVESRVSNTATARELTVQYQESDFAFISRLLEDTGIHYHFEPSPNGDKVVFSDGNAGFPFLPSGKLLFSTNSTPAVSSFSRGQSLHSGHIQAGDYNWKTPTTDLTAGAQAPIFGDLTERIFPAGVESKADTQAQATIRLAARIADAQQCQGESTYPQLQAGQRMFLAGHPRADFNQEYVITAVEHQRTAKDYRNVFRCLPVQIVFRPLPVTSKPIVSGVVSGIVVGLPGETKHVDQFGRVRIRFPWRSPSHSTQTDPGDSGFVRVAQIATGVGSTAMWLPDVGDEVAIAFEHGDPSRPVIIGSLYNGKDMPPVALPANKHLSILRAQSSTGQMSEMVFDVTAGNERLVLQSGAQALTLGTSGITMAGSSVTLSSGTSFQLQAGADLVQQVGRNLVLESGKDMLLKSGQNFALTSQRNAQFTIGDDAVIVAGKSLVTQSGTLFRFVAAQTGTIQVGDGLLAIQRTGDINIQGKDIAVTSSGNLTLKSSKGLTLNGSKISQN
ncbi:MAG: type VI secretion system tip protein TssI/VgrG [Nitrospirota bacterium]|nr:type VI secretion system tip protein TssI/VgrG [Nitrospirota bacterium]MDP3597605.1 type VI secretion system tip protein TssI/VgrG [Nitrospirota bacterium]